MRVLLTCTGPWGTGSGTVAFAVQKELMKMGLEVLTFFPDRDSPPTGLEYYYQDRSLFQTINFPTIHDGVSLNTFPLMIPDPNPRNIKNAWTYKDLTPKEINACSDYYRQELLKVLNEFKPHVIECQHIWILDYIIAKLGFSFISVAHNSDQIAFEYDPRMQEITKWSAHKAYKIFAISDHVNQKVVNLYGVPANKVITLKNGFDRDLFQPMDINREETLRSLGLEVGTDVPIIAFCGKLSKTKGVDILLKANEIIQAKTKAHIAFLGSGHLDQCLAPHETYCLKNTSFLGHRSPKDMIKLYNISRLSVLPSREEGFSIAALEAMGCGLPLVATSVGGLPDITVGRLVEPENPEQLAEAILQVLSLSDSAYTSLKKKAVKMAQNYSWENVVTKRLPFYGEVAHQNRSVEKFVHADVRIA